MKRGSPYMDFWRAVIGLGILELRLVTACSHPSLAKISISSALPQRQMSMAPFCSDRFRPGEEFEGVPNIAKNVSGVPRGGIRGHNVSTSR